MPVVLRPDYSGYTSPNRNHHEPGKDQILAYLKTKRQNGISQLLTIIEKQFNYRAMTLVLNHNFRDICIKFENEEKRAYNAIDNFVLEYYKSKNLPTKINVKWVITCRKHLLEN